MGNTEAQEAWCAYVRGLGAIPGPYLCECVCVSMVQPGRLCHKDCKTETLDAASPEGAGRAPVFIECLLCARQSTCVTAFNPHTGLQSKVLASQFADEVQVAYVFL